MFVQNFDKKKKIDHSQLILTEFLNSEKMIDSRNLKLELVQNTRQFMEKINFNLASKTGDGDCFETEKRSNFNSEKKIKLSVDICVFTNIFTNIFGIFLALNFQN